MTAGDRISQIRENLNISREALAKKLKVSTVTLWRWETGKREIKEKTLRSIAKELGVSVSDLLEEENKSFDSISTQTQPGTIIVETQKEALQFGDKLREVREGKDYSVEKLSKETGLPVSTIEGWEDGSLIPNLVQLIFLRKFFGTSVAYLLGERSKDDTKLRADDGDNIFFPYKTKKEILESNGEFSVNDEVKKSGCYIRWEKATDGDPEALIPDKWGFVPVDLHVSGLIGFGILEGSDVAVNPGLAVRSGDIVLAKLGDQLIVRRILQRPDSVDISSDNDTITISQKELDSGWFKVLGRVAVVLSPLPRL